MCYISLVGKWVKGNVGNLLLLVMYGIDNNILSSGARFLRVYREESKAQELCQEINIFFVGIKHKKSDKTAVHVYLPAFGFKYKQIYYYILKG